MGSPLGDLLATLAGTLGGGATAYGQALDLRQQKTRQSTLDALSMAAQRQQMQQGQESHDLGVLQATNPLARIIKGTAPAPQAPTLGPSAPFQAAGPHALAALAGAAGAAGGAPGGLAGLAAPRPVLAPGDAPGRYVQAGDFYADTGQLDPKTARDLQWSRAQWDALKATVPGLPEWTPGMDASKVLEPFLAHGDRVRGQDLEHGDRAASQGIEGRRLGLDGARLGVEQGNLDVARQRLAYEQQFGAPVARGQALANDYNHLKPVEDADKDATNAALALKGVQLARQGNREGQLMAITGFLRQTHPDAVVRTNDKGMLLEVQGVPAEMQAWFGRAVGHGGLLTPQALSEIEHATYQMVGMQRQGIAPLQANFGQRARAVGADSAMVARDPFAALAPTGGTLGHDDPVLAKFPYLRGRP